MALDCKRLVIQASSCKSCNVQNLIYPVALSWHLLRVGKTLWQCKCRLAFHGFTVFVCKWYLGQEWMSHSHQDILSNLIQFRLCNTDSCNSHTSSTSKFSQTCMHSRASQEFFTKIAITSSSKIQIECFKFLWVQLSKLNTLVKSYFTQ